MDIQISKGQGITQAIKAKLVDLGAKQKEFNSSIWDMINYSLGVDKESIFITKDGKQKKMGEVWNTKNLNSMVKTKVGDIVRISENTWNKIISWFGLNGVEKQDPTPPAQVDSNQPEAVDSNPPATYSENRPSNMTPEDLKKYSTSNKEIVASRKLMQDNPDGTKTEYNKDGYIIAEYDIYGNITRDIWHHNDDSLSCFFDSEYDNNRNETRRIHRDENGMVYSFDDYEYDNNGNITRVITRSNNGSVESYYDCEYDDNGNETKVTYRNSDNTLNWYLEYEYDEQGNKTKEIHRNANGTIRHYDAYQYVKNGGYKVIHYDADGNLKIDNGEVPSWVEERGVDYHYEKTHKTQKL